MYIVTLSLLVHVFGFNSGRKNSDASIKTNYNLVNKESG